MNTSDRSVLVALMGLTFATGLVDAASVLGLGQVFTANMTGNVVFLGFSLAGHGETSVVGSLVALGGFLVGAAVGGRLMLVPRRASVRAGLGLEVALLLAAVVGQAFQAPRAYSLVTLALAMGLRNAVVRKLGVPDVTTTVLTLTLTGLAADSSLAGGDNPRLGRRLLAPALMLAGAALGALVLPSGLVWVTAIALAVELVSVLVLVRGLSDT